MGAKFQIFSWDEAVGPLPKVDLSRGDIEIEEEEEEEEEPVPLPHCLDVFYNQLLSNLTGITPDLIKEAFHDDWETRPNPLNPIDGSGPGSFALNTILGGVWATQIPDLKMDVLMHLPCGDKHVVFSKLSATCSGETPGGMPQFLDLPQEMLQGKQINVFAIDIQTVIDGKIKQSVHCEDWAGAMEQIMRERPPYSVEHEPLRSSEALTEVPKCIDILYEQLLSIPNQTTPQVFMEAFHPDWVTRPNHLAPGEGLRNGAELLPVTMMALWGTYFTDTKFKRKEQLLYGDKITIFSEITATCSGKAPPGMPQFLGLPAEILKGKKFVTMAIDIHKVVDGKIKQSIHLEDWATAMQQIIQECPPPCFEHKALGGVVVPPPPPRT
jgi:hypothetical protein